MVNQHWVESTQGRVGSISWSRTRYLPFNRIVTQQWVESTTWSRTRCPHSLKRMALDAAQKNQQFYTSTMILGPDFSLESHYLPFEFILHNELMLYLRSSRDLKHGLPHGIHLHLCIDHQLHLNLAECSFLPIP